MNAMCWLLIPFAAIGLGAIVLGAWLRLAMATEARR